MTMSIPHLLLLQLVKNTWLTITFWHYKWLFLFLNFGKLSFPISLTLLIDWGYGDLEKKKEKRKKVKTPPWPRLKMENRKENTNYTLRRVKVHQVRLWRDLVSNSKWQNERLSKARKDVDGHVKEYGCLCFVHRHGAHSEESMPLTQIIQDQMEDDDDDDNA